MEKLFELIAPDECMICGQEGLCLCRDCSHLALHNKKPACVLCNALNNDNKTCNRCKAKTNLNGASIAYRYEGVVKDLIHSMKYENRRSIARYFTNKLPNPNLKGDLVVTFVPSDGKTRRYRGFDQAELLAKGYAQFYGLELHKLLMRTAHKKQVGQKRQQRFASVEGNFQPRSTLGAGKTVILIDDVVTTGATLSECAKVLHRSGVKKIWAVAIAKK